MYLLIKDNKNHFQYNYLFFISFMFVILMFAFFIHKYNYITLTPPKVMHKNNEQKIIAITIKPAPVVKKKVQKVIKKPSINKPVVKKIVKKEIVKKPIPVPVKKVIEKPIVKPEPKVIQKPVEVTKEVVEPVKTQVVEPVKEVVEKKVVVQEPKVVVPVFDAQKKASFISGLYAMLDENKKYPRMAKRRKLEGVVEVAFTLEKNGHIKNVILFTSCGHKILDKAALKLVSSIESYEPIPDEVSMEALNLKIPIKYSRS